MVCQSVGTFELINILQIQQTKWCLQVSHNLYIINWSILTRIIYHNKKWSTKMNILEHIVVVGFKNKKNWGKGKYLLGFHTCDGQYIPCETSALKYPINWST